MDRILRVRILGRGVQERAPAKPRRCDLAGDVVRYGTHAGIRRCRVLQCGRDGIPNMLIGGSYVCDDQIVFARKVSSRETNNRRSGACICVRGGAAPKNPSPCLLACEFALDGGA
jgi:hypothetical protein